MNTSGPTMAHQIAQAAISLEKRLTGHERKWRVAFMNDDPIVIAVHASLTADEVAQTQCMGGGARIKEVHRALFAACRNSMRQEIERITGMEVSEASVDTEPAAGGVVLLFETDASASSLPSAPGAAGAAPVGFRRPGQWPSRRRQVGGPREATEANEVGFVIRRGWSES